MTSHITEWKRTFTQRVQNTIEEHLCGTLEFDHVLSDIFVFGLLGIDLVAVGVREHIVDQMLESAHQIGVTGHTGEGRHELGGAAVAAKQRTSAAGLLHLARDAELDDGHGLLVCVEHAHNAVQYRVAVCTRGDADRVDHVQIRRAEHLDQRMIACAVALVDGPAACERTRLTLRLLVFATLFGVGTHALGKVIELVQLHHAVRHQQLLLADVLEEEADDLKVLA
mmetsp:Transcript_18423/g.46870  ORF Transcript_18423/g.46870 Transcript_18423/m.46870 type:complete len:225 (-) Transcript_18423:723-1397(-)